MKRFLILTFGTGLGLGVLVCSLGWWLWTRPCPPPLAVQGPGMSNSILMRIPSGMTLSVAADSLAEFGLLRDRSVFLLGARLAGRDRDLRAGLYELAHGLSPRDLLGELTSGLAVQVRVTIPEGLGAVEVAEVLSTTLGFSSREFLAVADSLVKEEILNRGLLAETGYPAGSTQGQQPFTHRFTALDSLLESSDSAGFRRLHWSEGYLAPDTYQFGEGVSVRPVAVHLIEVQLKRLQAAWESQRPGGHSFSPHELLTLASLVESEARRDDERTLVAAVYTNRLVRNWRLEADPTVAFILEKKGRRLYYKDLKVESPYNTYRQKGLPPGPIASPGASSLMAAARPDSTCGSMYFVSDGVGGHVFSRTIKEHEEAVRRFRKIREAGGRR
ncbi:MAG: endolytic transglycosylase MltG [Gemmatimonadales bacterium]|nr:endolytic transglycosylase MltG [Gemmatimonadales bacterium]